MITTPAGLSLEQRTIWVHKPTGETRQTWGAWGQAPDQPPL